jgi:hypothetical protein
MLLWVENIPALSNAFNIPVVSTLVVSVFCIPVLPRVRMV